MRIAVFGGSFSPVHTGHIALACAVLEKDIADKVIFVPCRRNPLKDRFPMFSDEERLSMIRIAIDEQPESLRAGMSVSDIEYNLPEPSYTWRTLEALKREYPSDCLLLLIGGDSMENFHKWANTENIVKMATLVVYPRPGQHLPDLPEGTILMEGVEESTVSSTEIRKLINEGGKAPDLKKMLTPGVLDMLLKN